LRDLRISAATLSSMKVPLLSLIPFLGVVHGRDHPHGPPQQHLSNDTTFLLPHGPEFVPDHVLRVSLNNNFSVACQTRPTVVVNGTSPGPPLYLQPGKTSWVRVYNDMLTENFTMVRGVLELINSETHPLTHIPALARP
jgi:hypothetical protein